MNAIQTLSVPGPTAKLSTMNLTPYCVLTEQATAASTAIRMTECDIGRRLA
jgi:hypothetical protein